MLIGAIVNDKYKILNCIGEGVYASIFEVINIENNTHYAMKKNTDIDVAINEITLLKSIDHPNIIKIIDWFYEENSIYMIIPCYNCNLEYYNDTNKYCIIMYKILQAVNYLSAHSIIHRDISMKNILLDNDNPILIDFGISKLSKDLTEMSLNAQILNYRPPEILLQQYDGKMFGFYDDKIDVWALGCLFVELVTHRQLFIIDRIEEAIQKIYAKLSKGNRIGYNSLKNYLIRHGVNNQNFISLVTGMLQIDPKKRLSSSECLKHPFFSNIKYEPIKNNNKNFIYPGITFQESNKDEIIKCRKILIDWLNEVHDKIQLPTIMFVKALVLLDKFLQIKNFDLDTVKKSVQRYGINCLQIMCYLTDMMFDPSFFIDIFTIEEIQTGVIEILKATNFDIQLLTQKFNENFVLYSIYNRIPIN